MFLTVLVDSAWQLDVFLVLATLQVANVRHLFAWNKADEMAQRQGFQDVVNHRLGDSGLLGNDALVDVAVVGKESAIVAQKGNDDAFLDGCHLIEAVEFVATDQKAHAGFVVGILVVVDIACAHEDLQGGMNADGEMVETLAELLDIELAVDAIAVAGSNLVVVGQMFVHIFNIFARGKGVVDALRQFAVVAAIEEQDGTGGLSVASGTTRLLEIGLDGIGTIVVDDQTDIGFVDAHTEGIGSYHDTHAVVLPVALSTVLVGMVESGMIEGGRESCVGEVFGNLASMATAAHIDDGRACCLAEETH